MKKYFKYLVRINDLYFRLVDYDDLFVFTTDAKDAYLFYTFKDALNTIKLFFEGHYAYPASVLIERVELY